MSLEDYLTPVFEKDDVCEHEEHDHGYCLNCGADVMDEMINEAHERS